MIEIVILIATFLITSELWGIKVVLREILKKLNK